MRRQPRIGFLGGWAPEDVETHVVTHDAGEQLRVRSVAGFRMTCGSNSDGSMDVHRGIHSGTNAAWLVKDLCEVSTFFEHRQS